MGRPIDADKLKQHYAWWNNEEKEIFDVVVDSQPTVCDLDKVVQELKEHPNVFKPFGCDELYIPLRDVLEVVKAGGIGSHWWNS